MQLRLVRRRETSTLSFVWADEAEGASAKCKSKRDEKLSSITGDRMQRMKPTREITQEGKHGAPDRAHWKLQRLWTQEWTGQEGPPEEPGGIFLSSEAEPGSN